MKISAVVPVYNGQRFIADCLNSLLKQTRKFDEIIVVDDGSTDDTVEMVKKFPVKLMELKGNKGRSYARNVGLAEIKSDFVLFVEADAIYSSNFLKLCLKHFKNPKVAGVIGKQEVWNRGEGVWAKCKSAEREANFLDYKPFSAWLYRVSLVKKLKGFDESLDFGEDVDLARRVQGMGYALKYEQKAVWKHYEPVSLLKILRRQWVFGFGIIPFYRKNAFPFKVIALDFLFFLSLLAGFLFFFLWFFSFIYILIKLWMARKAFSFISGRYWLPLAIFLILSSFVFKFARIVKVISLH